MPDAPDDVATLRAEVEEYRRWREGKIGVEDYYTLRRSAQVQVSTLRARVAELERDCGEAYQVVGALWPAGDPAVVKALDNLDAAATGKPRPHDDLLPFVPTPDPRDASLPWPCTCGRTSMVGCDRCDPRDARIAELSGELEYAVGRGHDAEARIAELEAALREVMQMAEHAIESGDALRVADVYAVAEDALGEEAGRG